MKALYNEPQLELRTPEGMEFSLPLAGPVSRMLALLMDILVTALISGLVGKVVDLIAPFAKDFAGGITVIIYFLISMLYGILCEWLWQGQTVGKRLVGIRVMDRDGLPIGIAQIIVRNLLRPVDMLPVFYLLGGAFALFTRNGQRLGDLAANTVVVRARESKMPDFQHLFAGKFNSLLDYPHLAARLCQRVSPELGGVALDAMLRRDSLDPRARVELFAELARRLRHLVEFPPEAVESLSDEQFVRNVLEIVYRTR